MRAQQAANARLTWRLCLWILLSFLAERTSNTLKLQEAQLRLVGRLTPFLVLWDTLRQKCEFMLDKKPENVKFKSTFPNFELRKIKVLGI